MAKQTRPTNEIDQIIHQQLSAELQAFADKKGYLPNQFFNACFMLTAYGISKMPPAAQKTALEQIALHGVVVKMKWICVKDRLPSGQWNINHPW